jgi:hypothetical protein
VKNKEELVMEMTKALMDQGLIIEAGWMGLKIMAVADDAPPVQIEEMRNAFFAGAQHLFASIMHGLDPDKEPTETDMRRLDLIDAELRRFIAEYEAKLKGRA